MDGDVDIARVASVIGDPARARVLTALGDGRALPASVLATEAGVAASTASAHLNRLVDAGLLTVTSQGRHRYYRLVGREVVEALEALARLAPAKPVRSLREGTRAHALRRARMCYDHLAGRLGVALLGALVDRGAVVGHDGSHRIDGPGRDRLAAPGVDVDYRLGEAANVTLAPLGVDLAAVLDAPGRRPVIRYCVDWSEQRHHLAGRLGAALSDAMYERRWIRHAEHGRAVHVTDAGRAAMADLLGLEPVE